MREEFNSILNGLKRIRADSVVNVLRKINTADVNGSHATKIRLKNITLYDSSYPTPSI